MSIRSLTYQQSVSKRYHSDKHFWEFYLQDGAQKSTDIDTEQNYVSVTLYTCIHKIAQTAVDQYYAFESS